MIRPYTQNDWEDIKTIFNRAKPDELGGAVNPKQIVPLEKDPALFDSFKKSTLFVKEVNNQIIGYVGNNGNLISFLFVDPAYYGCGYGSELLKYILSQVGKEAWLIVAKTNIRALHLYAKYGFSTAEEFQGMYAGVIPVNVLRLALNPELKGWLN
jgi:ribosomal protein S18 acetylase RimI-like enzyme